ncbi:MAG: PASTA domain-containing protein [Burkholderiaceae bacterium]
MRRYLFLLLGAAATAAGAQPLPCSTIPASERVFARAAGACVDTALIVDRPAPTADIAVPSVVGLTFDDAKQQLARFKLQRSYRPSAEPGGMVLAQQPAPPARRAAGATITVVLSDGSLRPPPRVPASEIDEPKPVVSQAEPQPQPAVAIDKPPAPQIVEPMPARVAPPQSAIQPQPPEQRRPVEQVQLPNVVGLSIDSAQPRLNRFKVRRLDRESSAAVGRIIEQRPKASARAAAGQEIDLVVSSGPAPVIETFEVPNVVGRVIDDATSALTEFRVERVSIAEAAPSGQVLAQEPAPGSSVPAGSAIVLRVSDGSLASPAVTPSATPAPSPAPAAPTVTTPARNTESIIAMPGNVLLLAAAVLLGLLLGVLLIRQWLRRRATAVEVAAQPLIESPAAEVSATDLRHDEVTFAARLDPGQTSIQFAASSEAEADAVRVEEDLHG